MQTGGSISGSWEAHLRGGRREAGAGSVCTGRLAARGTVDADPVEAEAKAREQLQEETAAANRNIQAVEARAQ